MDRHELEPILKALASKKTALSALSNRKRDEAEHHNRQRDKAITESLDEDSHDKMHGNKKFYSTAEQSSRYLEQWIRQNAPGHVFLDYACGNGTQVIQAAQAGAALAIGIDLSGVSIEMAREAAKRAGVHERCYFIQGDCEKTELPDECVDVILCSGVLHHMDLSFAFPEMRRILKPGARVLAFEALNYNPVIRLYRMMTPEMRTEWEKDHILSLKEVRFASHFFKVQDMRFWHLSSVVAAYFRNLPWLFRPLLSFLTTADRVLLKIPGVRLLGWQFSFEMHKTASL